MMEKIKDAMNEERRTSDTPYCCVDSIKCKENAMPGSTLTTWWLTRWSESGPRVDRGGHQSGKKETSPMMITIFFFKLTLQRKQAQSQGALYNSTRPSSRSSTMGRGHVCPAKCPRQLLHEETLANANGSGI